MRGFFEHLERKKYKLHVRVFLSRYRGYSICPDCGGARLRPEARQVKIGGTEYLRGLQPDGGRGAEVLRAAGTERSRKLTLPTRLLEEIRERLRFLNDVGLEYLTLDRLVFDALRRRSAAHSAGDVARIAAGGHALRARRALDRTALAATRIA